MDTLEFEEILELAVRKLGYKSPNVSLSVDPARFNNNYLVSVGSSGIYMSAKGNSFEEAANSLLESLKSLK